MKGYVIRDLLGPFRIFVFDKLDSFPKLFLLVLPEQRFYSLAEVSDLSLYHLRLFLQVSSR